MEGEKKESRTGEASFREPDPEGGHHRADAGIQHDPNRG